MSAKQNYDNLVADRMSFEARMNQARITLEEETDRIITSKLNYLAGVGRSVLKKKLGAGWSYADISYLGDLAFLLKSPSSKVANVTATRIEFSNPKLTTQRPNGAYFIDRSIIHMSDREFAKAIRSAIYANKARLKKLELDNAAAEIKKIENEIEKNNREVTRLQNLVKTQKEALAQNVEEKEAQATK